jgi:ABC-type lipoprotein export system ATPase subunit
MAQPVLVIESVEKRYQGLRPLRLQSLTLLPSERVAIVGLDAGGAEVLVNLVTGASVADRGAVSILGRNNAEIANGDEWLASLDRFGIVSERAVLLEGATLEQNMAMPFTLQIDPLDPDVATRVEALARECGILAAGQDRAALQCAAGDAAPEVRARVHLARAIALDPVILVLEHPTAAVPAPARDAYAADLARVTTGRGMATLMLTQDERFAQKVATKTLKLNPATGALRVLRRGWFT